MADTDVNKQVIANVEGEKVLGWIVQYEAGRDAGDHFVAGFSTPAMHSQHGGTYGLWMQDGAGVGGGAGTFSIL